MHRLLSRQRLALWVDAAPPRLQLRRRLLANAYLCGVSFKTLNDRYKYIPAWRTLQTTEEVNDTE